VGIAHRQRYLWNLGIFATNELQMNSIYKKLVQAIIEKIRKRASSANLSTN